MTKPRIESGMSVRIQVGRLHQEIAHYIRETDLGMQELLDRAVRDYLEGGGLESEVASAVADEMPKLVQSVVRSVLWDMKFDFTDAVRERIERALGEKP